MIAELSSLIQVSQDLLWLGFAVFMRIGGMMAVLPAFGDQTVPARVRLVLTLMFTLVVAPAVGDTVAPLPGSALVALSLLGPEAITGLFFGIFLRFFILALQIAGAIAAQATSLSQIFGGSAGLDAQPAIGHLFVVAGTGLAALSGLHVQAAAYMIHSYSLVGFASALDPGLVAKIGMQEVTRSFELGMSLAAPFVIASLVYNVVLGVINRAMPQLMVSFIGAPALTAGGLLILCVSAPVILAVWFGSFAAFMADPFGLVP